MRGRGRGLREGVERKGGRVIKRSGIKSDLFSLSIYDLSRLRGKWKAWEFRRYWEVRVWG